MIQKDFIFKPSKSKNGVWNLLKTILQTSFFWIIFLFIIPNQIVRFEVDMNFPPKINMGWGLFIVFSLLGIYSGITMSWIGKGTPLPLDCPNKLVIKGPYKIVRNPMAVAGIGQGVCMGLILGSYLVILYALTGAFLWHLFVRPYEERDLETRFGKAYLMYKQKTKCWIPRFNVITS